MLIKDPKIVDIKSLYSEGLISLFFNYLSIDHSFGNECDYSFGDKLLHCLNCRENGTDSDIQ